MRCPNCGEQLPKSITARMSFCPMCGSKLFEKGRKYLIEVICTGQRDIEGAMMMVFVDDKELYEIIPGDSICFAVDAGIHTLKFRYKIRSKSINILVTSNYSIKTYYNSLSSLIENSVIQVPNSERGITEEELDKKSLSVPVMVSSDGKRTFEIMLGDDDPEYEIRVSSGFKEGILRLYSERCEFSHEDQFKKDVTYYKNIVAVKKKMGAIDMQCDGNVHKVYSIPKDIYNEVMAFLNNRIQDMRLKG